MPGKHATPLIGWHSADPTLKPWIIAEAARRGQTVREFLDEVLAYIRRLAEGKTISEPPREHDMTSLSITTAAPADPATVTEYGDALPELVRALNHITFHHEAMESPADAERLLRNVAQAVSRLPQLLEQVSHWLAYEYGEGRIQVTGAESAQPASAVEAAGRRLEACGPAAATLRALIESAAALTAQMAART